MKLKDLAKLIDKEAIFLSEGMQFDVKIVDVKSAYGRIDFQIIPLGGTGNKWVSEERIKFNDR